MRTVVLKVGGNAAGAAQSALGLAREMAALAGSTRFVLVHGGGPQLTQLSKRLGHEPRFRDGVRQTTPAEMEDADMVLAGSVSTALVRGLCAGGVRAVGVSGADAGMLKARSIGEGSRTGTVEAVDPALLGTLMDTGYVPVMSSVATDERGEGLNINADEAALAVAAALRCHDLVFVSDVPGILKGGALLGSLDASQVEVEIAAGTITGGMLPKVKACLGALERGVGRVVITDYQLPGDLGRIVRGEKGTAIVGGPPAAGAGESLRIARDHKIARSFARELLVLERGEGVWLEDAGGRRYLDFAGGIAVNALGYGRGDLAEVAAAQMRKLIHTSNLFTTRPALELAKVLVATGPFAAVQFQNSGSEANEAAIKFARLYSLRRKGQGNYQLLSFSGSFHGRTLGALSLTPTPKYQDPFGPLVPGCYVSPYNDVEALEKTLDRRFAAVIVEVVQGEGGLDCMTPAFAQALNRLCRAHDVLLIADEVQTGLARTGSLFASKLVGLEPDIITLAKPLAAGLPLAAALLPAKVNDLVHEGEHGGTFPGGPVTTAVALKVWETIGNPVFIADVRRRGELFGGMLEDLTGRHPGLGAVKGMGLLRGIEVTAQALKGQPAGGSPTQGLIDAAREEGLLVLKSGANRLRLAPPLVVTEEELAEGVRRLEGVLARYL